MSIPAILFALYLVIGLLLLTLAGAWRGKASRSQAISGFPSGDQLDAWLLLFIALLWPVWLLATLMRKHPKS